MHIEPKIHFADARELEHGQLVILNNNRAGLVWKFKSLPRRSFAIALDDFGLRPIENESQSQIYIPIVSSSWRLELHARTMSYNERSARPGDILISSTDSSDGYFLVLRDPIDNDLYGFSFDDTDKIAHIHRGYIAIFKGWSLQIETDNDPITLVSRAPPDVPRTVEA